MYALLLSFLPRVCADLFENRSSIPHGGVTLSYGGSNTLTIRPPVGRVDTLRPGDEIYLEPNDHTYTFTHDGER
jgi:hypothetical protein